MNDQPMNLDDDPSLRREDPPAASDPSASRRSFRMQAPVMVPGLDVELRGYLSGLTGPPAYEDAQDASLDDETFLVNTLRRLVRTPESKDADPAGWTATQRREALTAFLDRNPRLRPPADQEILHGFREAVKRQAAEHEATFTALRDVARTQLTNPLRQAIETATQLNATMRASRVGTRQYEEFVRAVQAATDPLSSITRTIAEIQARDRQVLANAMTQLRREGSLSGVADLLPATRPVPAHDELPRPAPPSGRRPPNPPPAEDSAATAVAEPLDATPALDPAIAGLLELLTRRLDGRTDARIEERLADLPRWRKPEIYIAALALVVVIAIAVIGWWRDDQRAGPPASSASPTAPALPSVTMTPSPSLPPSPPPTPIRTAAPRASAPSSPSAPPSGP